MTTSDAPQPSSTDASARNGMHRGWTSRTLSHSYPDTDPSSSRTHVLAKPMSSSPPIVSRRSTGATPLPTALPSLTKTVGTALSDIERMSSRSLSSATAWYGTRTDSALVLNASIRSSASCTHVRNHTSRPRTRMFLRTVSRNVRVRMLSQSVTTAGMRTSPRGIEDAASWNGITPSPVAGTQRPSGTDTAPTTPSSTSVAKTAGMCMAGRMAGPRIAVAGCVNASYKTPCSANHINATRENTAARGFS